MIACSLSFYFKCKHVSVIMHVQYAVHPNDIFDINEGVRKVGEGVVCLVRTIWGRSDYLEKYFENICFIHAFDCVNFFVTPATDNLC